jgi:cell division protein FtsQ
MKRILQISFMVILIAGSVFLVAFTDQEHQRSAYKSFSIEVLNPSEQALITSDEIKELVINNFGEIEGAPVARIDLFKLENSVLANPYVSSCEVFQTIGGALILKARVREPLVRIINQDDRQFYLDYNGYAMPLNPAHPSLVPVANGNITDQLVSLDKTEKPLSTYPENSILHQVYPVAYYIAQDEFLKSFIDQIYVNEKLEVELVPKIGSQTILFGSSEDAKEKLENLKTFYQKVMSKMDWNTYTSINLKYKNQVVCAKYNTYE